jgi:Na+/proline symporter
MANRAMASLKARDEHSFRLHADALNDLNNKAASLRKEANLLLNKKSDTNDTNYIFLWFVRQHFPQGFTGLLIAVIFLASMGSLAAGLNSLASSTAVDIYMRSINKNGSDKVNLLFSRAATLFWGVFCIISALYAGKAGNLIEVVNIIGSVFYGTILGIFLVAFYLRSVNGNEVFYAALIAEALVILCWYYNVMAFLWLNVAGCLFVVALSVALKFTGWLNRVK